MRKQQVPVTPLTTPNCQSYIENTQKTGLNITFFFLFTVDDGHFHMNYYHYVSCFQSYIMVYSYLISNVITFLRRQLINSGTRFFIANITSSLQ